MMEEFQHILVPVDGSEPSVRALEKAVYLAEKCGSQVKVRLLREMRQSLQDGCGCDENAQPYRVHPLRNVHPRLFDESRVLPLRLRRR